MRLLVTGAGGMLGRDVARAGERAGHEMSLYSRAELDILDPEAVAQTLERERPEAVVNCAAWTKVDLAESRPEEANALNGRAAGELARICADIGAKMVQVSTDYVFDGQPPRDGAGEPRPYVESDPTGPRSVYGQGKLEGEIETLAASPRHVVARTAWLFGVDGPNFVATMLRLAGEREAGGPPRRLEVVDDQTGCPTWTGHLAPALIGLVERDVSGLAHVAASGSVTWNGFAREIFRQAEVECEVAAVSSERMARPAPRPAYSVLGSERDDLRAMPDWREGLAGYLAARDGIMRP